MIIDRYTLVFHYCFKSKRMMADCKHWRGISYTIDNRWTAEGIFQLLVDKGLAKVERMNVVDNVISAVSCRELTIEMIEDLWLTEADKKRIDKWLNPPVYQGMSYETAVKSMIFLAVASVAIFAWCFL